MRSDERWPVNIGNPKKRTLQEIAELVIELSASESSIVYEPLPEDDPKRRCPEIRRAREALSWEPRVGAKEDPRVVRRTLEPGRSLPPPMTSRIIPLEYAAARAGTSVAAGPESSHLPSGGT
ncbi:MAG TPA: hypothetical protein VFV45_05595 [Rubrobacteraceae bacterium]|nr:hypothetical protein [Rubrobacteraceae bacterium]